MYNYIINYHKKIKNNLIFFKRFIINFLYIKSILLYKIYVIYVIFICKYLKLLVKNIIFML